MPIGDHVFYGHEVVAFVETAAAEALSMEVPLELREGIAEPSVSALEETLIADIRAALRSAHTRRAAA